MGVLPTWEFQPSASEGIAVTDIERMSSGKEAWPWQLIFRSETRDVVKVKEHGRAPTASAAGTQRGVRERGLLETFPFSPSPGPK